jgi:type IV secretory pathway TrbL component
MHYLCLALIPLGVTKHFKFLVENGTGAIINNGVKLIVLSVIVGLGFSYVKNFATSTY